MFFFCDIYDGNNWTVVARLQILLSYDVCIIFVGA